MTHEQRRGDVRWKRAEQRILQMKLDQMTKQRRLAIGRAVSEPALPMIPHCLLHDAFVLMVDGTTKLVRYLDVGDKVQIAYCHRGAVLRGVSTVDSVHTNRPKRRDVTLVTSTGRGCVAMVTSDHSFLAKRAEGDFQWGPVIAGGLSRHHLGMEIEVNPHNRVQDLVGWERPVRFEQVESTREADLHRYRNGIPFRFLVGDRVVQGLRTFINTDDHAVTHSRVTRSAPDADGGGNNHRAIASSRSKQWA
mmetsp:Transcript_56057/g.181788  ORF Transcript_56057/g.181788 Transcript_56057/m.181788 type:complete len:249 (+) Transcript_56057:1597-2343(+)